MKRNLNPILAISVIGILTGVFLSTIIPVFIFDKTRDARRSFDARTILSAINQYTLESAAPTEITTSLQMLGTATTDCSIECGTTGIIGTSSTDIAKEQSTTAGSFTDEFVPEQANDENPATFWLNNTGFNTGNQWWQIDLGERKVINTIEIEWFNDVGLYGCNRFRIQGSDDGETFRTALGPVNASGDGARGQYIFDDARYRYWRLSCASGTHPSVFAIREVSIFESLNQPVLTTSTCVDLEPYLTPDYTIGIPHDPVSGNQEQTHYAVRRIGGNRVEVRACTTDRDDQISYAN